MGRIPNGGKGQEWEAVQAGLLVRRRRRLRRRGFAGRAHRFQEDPDVSRKRYFDEIVSRRQEERHKSDHSDEASHLRSVCPIMHNVKIAGMYRVENVSLWQEYVHWTLDIGTHRTCR